MIHLSFDSERHPHAKVVPRFKCCGNGSYFTEAEVKDLLQEPYLTEEVRAELRRALNDNKNMQ